MRKLIPALVFLAGITATIAFVKPRDFEVHKTSESRKIYALVQDVQKELYYRLENVYIACPVLPSIKNDTLTIYYASAEYNDHNADCGIASGLLKKLLEEKGLKTEYVALKGIDDNLENNIQYYSSDDSTKGVFANHIFLKAGSIYIDPTWWQFYQDAGEIKDRVAVGTKEDLYKYFIAFNNNKSSMNKYQRLKKYFSLFADPKTLDPNCLIEYAAALYAENSLSDTIKIPITYVDNVDNYFMQQLDFFKEHTLIRAPNYINIKEIMLN